MVIALARKCMVHRGRVVAAWVVAAIALTVVARAVGPNYVTEYSLPGTQTQQATDLLKSDFPAQSGDADVIVFHVSRGASTHGSSATRLCRFSRTCGPFRT